ncbi:secondary thiamine-phosphate synthase enzyme [Vagococcus elongatus]|uniref:Secondary thiamine-phosphate synthase enzyme n=2 Tax=Vagococcus elongatus TaxID=180344 RepID=A0A430AQ44_9ENTE|nr:secondary thiamine-phosphate synthase enzyme [Vagococcus elongatus]
MINLNTRKYNQYVMLTDDIENIVRQSNIKTGIVTVLTKHTTTGIAVNEALECLISDLDNTLTRLVPEDGQYSHARMLHDYGSTAGNPTGHLKAHLTGNHCHFPIVDGNLLKGKAQDVFFCEFDGPSQRSIIVIVEGEKQSV